MRLSVPVCVCLLLGIVPARLSALPQVPNEATIYNTSGLRQTQRPVSIPRAFRQGEIAQFAGAVVSGIPVLTQCDVKNRWPDGSLKFAIVSFQIPDLPAGGSVLVSFASQPTGNNTGGLTNAELLDPRYDFDVVVEARGAATRSVSARSMISAGAVRPWLTGPIVTAVIIEDRTPARIADFDAGTGSRALHPIIEAWFYPGTGSVDVGCAVENTWASSNASQGMRDETYTPTVRSGFSNPVIEFTQPSFTHIGRSRWHRRFWVGPAPGSIRVDHNLGYLITTKAIPHYDPDRTIAPSLVASLYSAWTGTDHSLEGNTYLVGNYEKYLQSPGTHMWIGLMNTWETVYLMTMDDRMLEMTLGNADLIGRAPIHFREADPQAGSGGSFDEAGAVDTFGRMVSINARQTVTLRDLSETCAGGSSSDYINTGPISYGGWTPVARSHLPQIGYVPYIITGRYYYLEEMQYWAAFVLGLGTGCAEPGCAWCRQGPAGYIVDQIRGEAWGLRSVTVASFFSVDGSPEKAYFESKLLNNLAAWSGQNEILLFDETYRAHWDWGRMNRFPYTGQGVSPLGAWRTNPGSVGYPLRTDGSLAGAVAPWEENFFTSSLGLARQFGYPTRSLLGFMARRPFNLLLNPNTSPYFIESYVYPTLVAATNDWVPTWSAFGTYYQDVPTAWKTGGDVDHGYGFIALGSLSFLFDQAVDGYTGAQAWAFLKANKPEQQYFSSQSPKWDILPDTDVSSMDAIAPAPPGNVTVR